MDKKAMERFANTYAEILRITGQVPNKELFVFTYEGDKAEAEVIWYLIDLQI